MSRPLSARITPAYKCVTSNTYKNYMNICNDPSLETFVIGLYMLRSLWFQSRKKKALRHQRRANQEQLLAFL